MADQCVANSLGLAIRGIILDVDGTLVDSNDAHAHAWIEALAEHGIDVAFEKVRRLIGMGGDKLLPKVCGLRSDEPAGARIVQRRGEIFKARYLPNLKPTPGAQALLQRLHAQRLRLGVASSAKKSELDELLRVCGALKLVDEKVCSDDADRSKPDPDIVQAALNYLNLPAAETMMLGDTPYDVEAAQSIGVKTIAFRCGGWSDHELAGASVVYENPADLLAHYDASLLNR